MMQRFALTAGFVLAASVVGAITPVQAWQQRWAGSETGVPTSIAARELADGSRMVVAYFGGLNAIRYDSNGNQLSVSSFYPPFFSPYTDLNAAPPRFASVVTIDPFGGIFIASVSDLTSTRGDIWLMKYDGLGGKPLWPAPVIFDGPTHRQDFPVRLLIDSQGNAVLIGRSHIGGSYNMVLFKCLGVSGGLLWGPITIATTVPVDAALDLSRDVFIGTSSGIYKFDGQTGAVAWGPVPFGANITALAVAPDGSAVVAGSGSADMRVAKYSATAGTLVWGPAVFAESSFPPPIATGVGVSSTGDVVLSGTSGSEYVVLEYSGANGTLLWGPQRASATSNAVLRVNIAANGDVVASGCDPHFSIWRYSGGDGSLLWGPQADAISSCISQRLTTLITSNGRILSTVNDYDGTISSFSTQERDPNTGSIAWSAPFSTSVESISYVTDVTQGPDGSVFVTGYDYGPTVRFVTFKYARSDGAVIWGPVFYDVPGFGYPYVVRTDSAGDVFVLGVADGAVVLKYSGTTGSQLWGTKIAGASPSNLAIDASGDAFILGQTYNGTDYDFATAKLSGATGAVMWGPVPFNRGPGRNDWPTVIGVTPGGDVIVSGTAMASYPSSVAEWVTLKYSGLTGALLWGPVLFSESGADGDSVRDLAIDAFGNFYLVGKAFNGSDNDMVTVKYDGATGGVLWGPKLVAGSGTYYDEAAAVALDSNGDVFVGGSVYSDHTPPAGSYSYDFATIKYRGSDGAVLWGPVIFNGSANDNDLGYALALDSGGNPVVAGTSRNAAHNKDIALLKYDGATGAPVWGPVIAGGIDDDDLPLHNLVVRGKSAVIAGTSAHRILTVAYDEVFGIETIPGGVPPAYCGIPFLESLVAGNATGSVSWSVVAGALPPGLSLDPSTGEISGTPTAIGSFPIRIRVHDSAGPTAERDFVIEVFEGSAFVPVLATANPICPGQTTTLSVPGSWVSYQWLRSGETSSSISVSPTESTDYGVLLGDATGCLVFGYGQVVVASHPGPILAPASVCANGTDYAASVSDAGAGAAYLWSISNGTITAGAGTRSIKFTAGGSGSVELTVTVTKSNGCSATSAKTVAIVSGPGCGLAMPAITAPGSGAMISVSGVTFSWGTVSGASGYDLRVFDAATGATLFSGSLLGLSSTSELIDLPNGSDIFAVRACLGGFSDSTCGPFGTRSFGVSLTAPGGAPTITAPGAGAHLTSSTQTFSWTAVAKADLSQPLFYEVFLTDVAAGKTELQIKVPDPTLSTTYSLHSSTQYRLQVRACQAGCGPYSSPVLFSASLAPVPSSGPTVTSAVVSGGNSLAVAWTAVSGADIYRVYVVEPTGGPGGGALTVAARQVSTTSVTVPVPSGFANIVAQACTGDGCGPFGPATGINPAGPNPAAPNLGTPLGGTVVDGPGVSFSWSRVPGDTGSNTLYRLYVQDLSRQAAALDVYTTQNFYAADFKAEGTRYDALVVANPGPSQVQGPASGFNVRGASAASPTMASPGHQSSLSQGNIQLGWTPVPGATLYEYFVAVQGQPNATVMGVTPGLFVQTPLPAVGGNPTVYSGITRACPAGNSCAIDSDSGWGPWSNAPGGPGVTNFTVTP
jgi:hypothetical protein